jgi:cyclohexadienyl dehydratase
MARFVSGFLLVLALALPAHAQTQPAPQTPPASKVDEIIAKGVLRVGTTGDYKPFTYHDQAANTFEGFDIDLASNLGQALGVKVEFVKTSWPTLMKDFTEGKFDVGFGGISYTYDRAKKAYFSQPYLREGKTPITRCENAPKFQTVADIDKPGVRVIVNPGGTNEKFARANLKTATITVFPDNTKIFDEIVKGNADLMITDASETRYQQKLKKELCAVHPDTPFNFSEKAYLLPRDDHMLHFVDGWLRTIREDGTYKAINAKWFE